MQKFIKSLTKSLCLLFSLFLILLSYQTNVFAEQFKQNKPIKIKTKVSLPAFTINKERAIKLNTANKQNFDNIANIMPLVIPSGTTLSKVSFYGIDSSSSVIVSADTNEDRVPETNDTFIAADDPANEIPTAMSISKTTGKIYIGFIAADGPNKQNGQIVVTNNSKGDFKASKESSFSIGKGTPLGLTVLNTTKGDVLIVASLFFSQGLFDINEQDSYTITAYLPGANGVPDGKDKVTILAANSLLNNRVINFGFGGLALDSKGNLYANVASKFKFGSITQLAGAIMSFTDSNNDQIPDKASIFATATATDSNPTTASSIVPITNAKGEQQFYVYGINDVLAKASQIVIYNDLDQDLKADGGPSVFYTASSEFQGIIGFFGDETSALTTSKLDFSDGQALFAFSSFDSTGNIVTDGGVALLKDNGTGQPSSEMKVFAAPKMGENVATISFVLGVPGSNDKLSPTAKILNISAGQKFESASRFTLNFSSSDDIGVVSHNILFAINGDVFEPLVLGLAGSANSFQFTIPNIPTTNAAIRLQALDLAGNVGSDTVMPLIIETDGINPTVIVTAPKNKEKLKGNTMFTITFTSSDDRGVVSHDFQFSPDNGANFVTFAQGLPGNLQSLTIMVPNMKIKQGLIKVIARDAAGNIGEGISGIFKIKPTK